MNDAMPIMKMGRGSYLIAEDGSSYLDACAGTFNLSLGYHNDQVLSAVKDQIDQLVHCTSSFHVPSVEAFRQALIETAPACFVHAHTKTAGGSVSVEGALKYASYGTKKNEVIAFNRSHHGQTFFTASLSGFTFRRENIPAQTGIHHVSYPYEGICKNTRGVACEDKVIRELEDVIEFHSQNQISAVIIEPILGSGGGLISGQRFLKKLREFCDRYDICLIFDEIQTGIGRTGHLYACEYFDVYPDILVTAKGLGGIGFQASAILCNEKYSKISQHSHSFTYGSSPVAARAATETLKIISDPAFLKQVRDKGEFLSKQLKALQESYPDIVKEVRSVGLFSGFAVASNEVALAIQDKLFQNHVLVRLSEYDRGDFVKIRPPLTISEGEIGEIISALDKVLIEVSHDT